MKRTYMILLFPFCLLLLSFSLSIGAPAENPTAGAKEGFIGAETCKECHETQYGSYAESIHFKNRSRGPNRRMRAKAATVQGPGMSKKAGGAGWISSPSARMSILTPSPPSAWPAMKGRRAWISGPWESTGATTSPAIPATPSMPPVGRSRGNPMSTFRLPQGYQDRDEQAVASSDP